MNRLTEKVASVLKHAISDELISESAGGALSGGARGAAIGAALAGGGTYAALSPKALNHVARKVIRGAQEVRVPAALIAALIGGYFAGRNIGLPLGALAGAARSPRIATPPRTPDPLDTDRLTERERALLALLRN